MAAIENENVDMDATWRLLEGGLDKAFRREPMPPKDYMQLYSKVYNHCTALSATANMAGTEGMAGMEFVGQELYDNLEKYISNYVTALRVKCDELPGESILDFYTTEWINFQFSSRVMDGICAYLNRHWIRREQDEGRDKTYMVYTLALVIWKRDMFDPLEKKVIGAVLELIRLERNGNPINNRLISSVVENLVELGMDDNETVSKENQVKKLVYYKKHFEETFLETSRLFYKAESDTFLKQENGSCTDYMLKVETRIRQEEDRVALCLHQSTAKPLSDVCDQVLISDQIEFIQASFGPLLVEQRDEHLGRMYNLCCRITNGLDALRDALERHVIKEGQVAMENVKTEAFNDPKLYIKTLLFVHERYQELVEKSFKRESGFTASLDRAASNFVNHNSVTRKAPPNSQALKSSELISRYCDGLFKKSSKMPDEIEMEALQVQVLVIFKYLEDKDIFLKFYTKMFSKRLINELSASDEAEKSFIAKLTASCGFEYTSRLSKMITDLQVSKDLTSDFKEKNELILVDKNKKSIEFNSLVLSSGSWPTFPDCPLTLPQQLGNTIEGFTRYYQERFNGRRLQWAYSQCRGEVTCSAFKGKKYVFLVTTPQMCTLLLFNEQQAYTVEQIQSATGMDKKTNQMIVHSLITNNVLKSDTPSEGDVIPFTATLSLNATYTNKKVKVDLSRMTMKQEAVKDTEAVQKNADEDRKNVISAAIVRIMKMRKTFVHTNLVAEVISQLQGRFKPKVDMIKRCIGMLIEKEYLRRSEGQKDQYEYVA